MIYKINNNIPNIHENAFIAQSSDLIGDVKLCEDSSVWFGAVVRGDTNRIFIGKGSNIQDNCTIHVNEGEYPVIVGDYVTVGHGVILHGCKIGSNSLVGMGATILDGVEVGENTIIGAGSLITAGKKIPSGVLCMGSPARVVRELTEDEIKGIKESAEHYIEISKRYMNI